MVQRPVARAPEARPLLLRAVEVMAPREEQALVHHAPGERVLLLPAVDEVAADRS